MFDQLFAERLVKTGCLEKAVPARAMDAPIANAIHSALLAHNLVDAFTNGAALSSLNDSSDPAWVAAVESVFQALGGHEMPGAIVAATAGRLKELRLEPFDGPFVRLLQEMLDAPPQSMFLEHFTGRLSETDCMSEALRVQDLDDVLAIAVRDALEPLDLFETFMMRVKDVPRQLTDTTDVAWSRAAVEVYTACGGATQTPAQLFAFMQRIAQLRLEPLGAVFAAALVQMAERDGWPATLAAAANVPIDESSEALRSWAEWESQLPKPMGLLRTALDSELAFTEPGDVLTLDSTHDSTFVQQQQE